MFVGLAHGIMKKQHRKKKYFMPTKQFFIIDWSLIVIAE